MKITPRKNKKKIIIITAIIVLLALGTTAVAYFYKLGPFTASGSTVNMAPATQDQQEAGDAIKQQSSDAATENKPSGSDQPQSPTIQPGSTKATVTTSITAANQNGSILQIRSLIEVLSSDGTCTLTLSKPGYASVVKTAKTQAQASTSTCQGFDIPISELSTGTWTIGLVFESASLKGEASKTVTIQ